MDFDMKSSRVGLLRASPEMEKNEKKNEGN